MVKTKGQTHFVQVSPQLCHGGTWQQLAGRRSEAICEDGGPRTSWVIATMPHDPFPAAECPLQITFGLLGRGRGFRSR